MKWLALLLPLLLAAPAAADDRSLRDRLDEVKRLTAEGAADALAGCLSDEAPMVRSVAAWGLAGIGAVTTRVRAGLVERLADPDLNTRAVVARTLVRLDLVEGTGVVEALASMAGLETLHVAVEQSLEELGPRGAGAGDALRRRASFPGASFRLLDTLATVSPRELGRLLRDPAPPREVRSDALDAASRALGRALADPRREQAPFLEPLLAAVQEGPDVELRRRALLLLGPRVGQLPAAQRLQALAALDAAATRPGEDEAVVGMARHQASVARAALPEQERLGELVRRLAPAFDEAEASLGPDDGAALDPFSRTSIPRIRRWAGTVEVKVDAPTLRRLDAAWAHADDVAGGSARLRLVFDDLRLRASVHVRHGSPTLVISRPLGEGTPTGPAVDGERPFTVRSLGVQVPYEVLEDL